MVGKMAKRGTNVDIYKQIFEFLKSGKYNIHQISIATKINWETIRNTIQVLKNLNLISSEIVKGKKQYFLKDNQLLNFKQNTLLGLPLKQEQEEKTKALFKRIKERWLKKETDKILNKTFSQKIAVRLIKEEIPK